SLPLLDAFWRSVKSAKAPAHASREQIDAEARQAALMEEELTLDPSLFFTLRREIPGLRRVAVRPKRGRAANELTRFRYDVTLEFGAPRPLRQLPWSEWGADVSTLGDMAELLRR